MASTRMSGMSMAAAIVPWHAAITEALDRLIALAGTEGTTVIDPIVRTHLSRVKGVWAALDLLVINADCQNQRALRVGCKGNAIGPITMIGHIDGQKFGTCILVLDHAIDLQSTMAQCNTVFVSRI